MLFVQPVRFAVAKDGTEKYAVYNVLLKEDGREDCGNESSDKKVHKKEHLAILALPLAATLATGWSVGRCGGTLSLMLATGWPWNW
jgi:hypothetical protein